MAKRAKRSIAFERYSPGKFLEEAGWMHYCGDREGARRLLLWLIRREIVD